MYKKQIVNLYTDWNHTRKCKIGHENIRIFYNQNSGTGPSFETSYIEIEFMK